jgi:hypothetical protein
MNAVLSFLTAHAFSKLEDLFAHSVTSPLLFAGLLRTLFCHALTNDFFATERFMSPLTSVALKIQQTRKRSRTPTHFSIASQKSTIFSLSTSRSQKKPTTALFLRTAGTSFSSKSGISGCPF